jgi:hypothetical protein
MMSVLLLLLLLLLFPLMILNPQILFAHPRVTGQPPWCVMSVVVE